LTLGLIAATIDVMANPERLTALDTMFLHIEDNSTAHMHVASVMVFDGHAPTLQELIDHVLGRLHLVPRYRQRLAHVPYGQGRPLWTDDPHFNPYYHLRHTALPRPGDDAALMQLAGRLFSQRLDRAKPLWEIWLVEQLAGERFALIAKTHHALVDGISGVDITTVLFDADPEPVAVPRTAPWIARPLPGKAKLLGEALLERATVPGEMARSARALLRAPHRLVTQIGGDLASLGSTTLSAVKEHAPRSPFNVDIGPHRRCSFLDADLAELKDVKATFGGTLNDVVLTAVTLALGRYLRRQNISTEHLTLKAMVPVSVRADSERGALGNRVAAMWAPLPVSIERPAACLREVTRATAGLKRSGQAVGAQVLTNLAGFAPPTILSQAARLQARQPFFNLVVTNVPGPQFPLYLLSRRLRVLYPIVPLARRQALGIAAMSYDGHLAFGLLADYDALPELDALRADLAWAIAALRRSARAARAGRPRRRSGTRSRTTSASSNGTSARKSARAGRAAQAKPPAAAPRAAAATPIERASEAVAPSAGSEPSASSASRPGSADGR
jgi:diacylglycerol O-acyltransferase / wax synthase